MARKSLGHTFLFWICPNCDTRNPGPDKICTTCGHPQPDEIEFIQGDEEVLIKHGAEGGRQPDIHCPFCGTRNNADAKICSQCGGKLAGGKKRDSGRVVGAHKSKADNGINCLACGHKNQPNASRCANCGSALVQPSSSKQPKQQNNDTRSIWFVAGLIIFIVLGFIFFKGCSREVENGFVAQTAWQRIIMIEQFATVSREDWLDEIPSDGEVFSCEERYRYSTDEAVEGAIEVCGTPYTLDEGTGLGEVVQDCEYEVYAPYCAYEIGDWEVIETVKADGFGMVASWPSISASSNQRPGDRREEYTIWFDTEDGRIEFTTDDYDLFAQAHDDSEWELTYDGFGRIKSANPK